MATSALLVMDLQDRIVGRVADDGYVRRLAGAIDTARRSGVPVIYVVIGFRDGFPEANARNRMFASLAPGAFTENDDEAGICSAVAPRSGEIVVTKKRVSAFAGSDLEVVLRAGDVDRLVLTGVSTSGVVLSTLRQAADLDFGLTVLADGCYDANAEVHRVLTESVFPRQADVTTIDAWRP